MPHSLARIPALALALALPPAGWGLGGAPIPSAAASELREVPAAAVRPLGATEARALLGKRVRTRDGGSAGVIRDFTLAGSGGPIDHAVLESGGFLGFGGSLVSVPAAALKVAASPSVPEAGDGPAVDVILDLSDSELAGAAAFRYDDEVRTLAGGR